MADIPHASSYRGGRQRAADVARAERVTSRPIAEVVRAERVTQRPIPAPEPNDWIIGLTLILILVVGALVLTGHPWFGVIAAAASGGVITHLVSS